MVSQASAFEKGDTIVGLDHHYPEGALYVDKVLEDGTIVAYPDGGGFARSFSVEAQKKNKFKVVPKSEKEKRVFKRFKVTGDWIDEDEFYEAWTTGHNWNGWAIPFFELEEAKKVIKHLNDEAGETTMTYDEKADTIRTINTALEEGEQLEITKGQTVEVEEDGKKKSITVYPIGDGWCWYEYTAPEVGAE